MLYVFALSTEDYKTISFSEHLMDLYPCQCPKDQVLTKYVTEEQLLTETSNCY